MTNRASLLLLYLLPITLAAQQAVHTPAGKLTGTVTDSVLNSVLVGAGVALQDGDFRFVKGTITEPDGTYKIDGLTVGSKYWVTFCQQDYDPVSSRVVVPSTVDQKLNKHHAEIAYWNKKADLIFFKTMSTTNHETFAKTWDTFKTSAVSAEGKAYVARGVREKLKDNPKMWADAKDFNVYAAADPGTLDQAEQSIWSNKAGDPAVLHVDRVIIDDIQTHKATWGPVFIGNQRSSADPCNFIYH